MAMPKKYTIRDMQQWASYKGGKCLSKEYWNVHTKLTWMCASGHTWDAIPNRIRDGQWCPVCNGKQKGTIEQMQAVAAGRGGKCISKTYINANTRLEWECIKGHTWKSTAGCIKYGQWCPHCYGNAKLTIEKMQQIAKERGGKCISKKYINKDTHLKWQCAEGHTWRSTPGSIMKAKSWCPVCAKTKMTKGVHSTEEMDRVAKERKGKLLSKKYVNVDTPLKWQCARGHVWKASPYNVVRKGSWCGKCRGMDRRTKYKYMVKI